MPLVDSTTTQTDKDGMIAVQVLRHGREGPDKGKRTRVADVDTP